jgi:hypothetical protein
VKNDTAVRRLYWVNRSSAVNQYEFYQFGMLLQPLANAVQGGNLQAAGYQYLTAKVWLAYILGNQIELNFRDERYLPFEGAGAISTWQLELTQESTLRQFSYDTISDVILHMHYTSREDTGDFRAQAISNLTTVLQTALSDFPQMRLFDLMHDFPTEWYQFLQGSSGTLTLNIEQKHFPFLAQNRTIHIEHVWLYVRPTSTSSSSSKIPTAASVGIPPATTPTMLSFSPLGTFYAAELQLSSVPLDVTQPWNLGLSSNNGHFADGDIIDCYMAVRYTLY